MTVDRDEVRPGADGAGVVAVAPDRGGRAADLLAWALDLGTGIRNGSVAALGPWVSTRDDVVVSTLPGSAGEVAAGTVPPQHPGVLLDVVEAVDRPRVERVAQGCDADTMDLLADLFGAKCGAVMGAIGVHDRVFSSGFRAGLRRRVRARALPARNALCQGGRVWLWTVRCTYTR